MTVRRKEEEKNYFDKKNTIKTLLAATLVSMSLYGMQANAVPTSDVVSVSSPGGNYQMWKATEADPTTYAISIDASQILKTANMTITQGGSAVSDFNYNNSTKTGSGVFNIRLPLIDKDFNDSDADITYYTLNYAVPATYSQASRADISDGISDKYYYGSTGYNSGGGILIQRDLSSKNVKADFINNTVNRYGGGIFLNASGKINDIEGNFIGNKASTPTSSSSTAYYGGGAIRNGGIINNVTGNFIENSGRDGGAIAQHTDVAKITNINGAFIRNVARNGSAIYNRGTIDSIKGVFIDNGELGNPDTTSWAGGAIANVRYNTSDAGKINSIQADFINNKANNEAGAIKNDYKIGSIEGNFIGNYSGNHSGAIYNYSTDSSIDSIDGRFINNIAKNNGGALTNEGQIGTITGEFVKNKADILGGAIYAVSGSNIDSIDGEFHYNKTLNSNAGGGGAIAVVGGGDDPSADQATVGEIKGYFSNNTSGKGGAVLLRNRAHVDSIEADFYKNSASNSSGVGGAISVEGYSTVGTINGEFTDNTTSYHGGAIYVGAGSEITGKISGKFSNNTASASDTNKRGGGAIAVIGDSATKKAIVNEIDAEFNGNAGLTGGAIVVRDYAEVNKITGTFTENTANNGTKGRAGGAIYVDYNSWIGTIDGTFTKNTAPKDDFGGGFGGAIGFNNVVRADLIKGTFKENSSFTNGGAITVYSQVKIGKIDAVFESNSSAMGGAIRNTGQIDEIVGTFRENSSTGNGGAISNKGKINNLTASFTDNKATGSSGKGGAIQNVEGGLINLVADSADILFSGNTAKGVSNAIYQQNSTLNMLSDASKSITINDDITGEGTSKIIINKTVDYVNIDGDTVTIAAGSGGYIFNSNVSGNDIELHQAGTLKMGKSGSSTGVLNLGSKEFKTVGAGNTLDLKNGYLDNSSAGNTTQNLGNVILGENLNLKLDVDASQLKADLLKVNAPTATEKTIHITDINWLNGQDFVNEKIQILDNQNTTNIIKLSIDNSIKTKTETEHHVDGFDRDWIQWDEDFGGYDQEVTRTYGLAKTKTDDDSLTMTKAYGQKIYVDKYDNLMLINTYNKSEDREFRFTGANDEFKAIEDSGVTYKGTLNVNGISNGDQKSTINADGHKLFEITGSDPTTVILNDVKVTGASTVAEIKDGNKLVINNSEISGNTDGIVNNGDVEFKGTSKYDDKITGNNGKIEVKNGTTTFGSSADVTQKSLTTSGSSAVDNKGKITLSDTLKNDGKKFTNSGDVTTATLENEADLVNNGKLVVGSSSAGKSVNNSKISGSGTMELNSDFDNNGTISVAKTESSAKFTNEGTVSGEFTNKESGTVQNNSKISGKLINSGKVNNNGKISGDVDNKTSGIITTKIKGMKGGKINNDGTIRYTNSGSTVTDISGSGRVELRDKNDGTVKLNNDLGGNTLALYQGTLIFDKVKDVAGFEANGGTIDAMNGKNAVHNLGNVTLNGKTNMKLDFDLATETTDKFLNSGVTNNGGMFNVTDVRVNGRFTTKDYIRVHLGDTTTLGRKNVTSDTFRLPSVMTPIRRLSGSVSGGWLTYQGTGNSYHDFNPSVMASAVATQIGGFLTQSQTLQDSFYHMNRYTKYKQSQRMAAENVNVYADASSGAPAYTRAELPEVSSAMWVKPYTSFESVDLHNGPGVSNVAYGTLIGGDTDLYRLKNGYKGIVSAFIGYNGNHMVYDGVSMNQQGGTLGVTGTLYKGNFFTGITFSAGASGGEAYTQYGRDHFAMLTAGVANKTGYNWELNGGKIIIQPSLFTAYTFVNTFDYTNSAGVRIDSDPLNVIQLMPGIKIIGNTKTGWQPYAGVDMVWNIYAGRSDVYAAETKLPQLSVRPFVQYGVGIQKSWADRFTAFFQTMIRNGGRTGVVLQGGFRWAIGTEGKPIRSSGNEKIGQGQPKNIKVSNKKLKQTKSVKAKNVGKLKAQKEEKYTPSSGEKRVIRQLPR